MSSPAVYLEITPQQLQAWRHRVQLSQSRAAAALNVPETTYKQWEVGRRQPPRPVALLTRYVEQYGVLGTSRHPSTSGEGQVAK